MAVKKSELYGHLWKSCDELRGGMDASQYKDYVLALLFVKYVSDKYAGKSDAVIEVPLGGSFKDMVALKGKKDIGDGINKIISKLAEANDLKGVIDVADFNDSDKLGKGKDMQDRLTNLIAIFENPELNFSKNGADDDDILGDAYEYLMRHFATESGKSKGQFYTPAEVSRIMAKVIGMNKAKSPDQTIYDPTCGSGSLLLKAAHEAPHGITIYGQEMDNATRALAKMNMILHGNPTADIWQDNTLSKPHFKQSDGSLKTFDFVVANPPFSTKSWSNGFDPYNDEYERFVDGVAPAKNGDYAFMQHIIRSLKSSGTGAVILPHGVLFRSGGEAEIRKNIIRKGYIKGIISLPPNLFYGTSIPACIIVLDKAEAENRKGIFMLDASKGFMKDGNKNRLRHQDIHKIVDVFTKQIELPKYSRMILLSEIDKNEHNLNIPRYIDNSEEEDIQDIEAHLLGGIPNHDIEKLASYWDVYPSLKKQLFNPSERAGYSELKIEVSQIKSVIYEHPEFISYFTRVDKLFKDWQSRNVTLLKNIAMDVKPKSIIEPLAEDLLKTFSKVHLIDQYDVYQRLMSYWADTMQDDVHLIAMEGWQANKELVPSALVVNCYFTDEKKTIEQLEAERETIEQQIEEMEEEHSGEEGVLEELKSDKGKISKANLQKRIKGMQKNTEAKDELQILLTYMKLIDSHAEKGKTIKAAQAELDKKVTEKYKTFSIGEIKSLVVDDKWIAVLYYDVKSEIDCVSLVLTQRVKELAERYKTPLPTLQHEVNELGKKVESHLAKLGFVWR